MPRPRVHDLDRLLDVAEQLVARVGAEGVTVRTLATAANVPNGTIYHAFDSIGALLGRVWLRMASDFLVVQTALIDAALDGRETDPEAAIDAVVAAADAPAVFAEQRPAGAKMMLTVNKDRLLGPHLPTELADTLITLDKQLVGHLIRLTRLMWDRRDGAAVEVLTTCVVDLPTALFKRAVSGPSIDGVSPISADSRERLAAAVRAVLAVPPPPRIHRKPTTKD